MMKVLIEFIGYVSRKVGNEWLWMEIGGGETLHDLFSKHLALMLDVEVVESLVAMLSRGDIQIAVNGRMVDNLNVKLKDGDKIIVFPMAAGG